MKAMVLAAGLGKRMRPLTLTTPKPLLEVAGKPLIVYQLENLVRAGFTDIVINHAWLGDQIESYLGDGEQFNCRITYSAESEPLETAGGIRKALPMLANEDDLFLVVNGDVYTDTEYQTLDLRLASDDLAKLWLVNNPVWHPEGDFVLNKDRVANKGDCKLTFAGISLLRPSLFADVTPNEPVALAPLLNRAISSGQTAGERLQGYWNDVGTIDRMTAVEQFLTEGK